MQYAYTYISIPEITILGHSDPKMGITIEFMLKFDAICMYIYPDSRNYHIRSLDHKTGIMIEFTLKFDAICMYICPDSRNYHIRLLQSQNRYLSSPESIQSPILRSV